MNSSLKLTRPLIFFDLETTGLDFKYDRVIELAALKVFPDEKKETLQKRFNPGMRIPREITAITGISNEDVAKAPSFSESIDEIDTFFAGADLSGYNVLRFDAKVMVEEFKRTGRDFGLEARHVVDSQVIFHMKEKRDLAAAFKYFCNKDLQNAHSALADTEACYEIFKAQLGRYPDLPSNVEGLHAYCRGDKDRFVDAEGKFFWRDGEAVFNFGKYKSQTLKQVAKAHPEYLSWVVSPERHFGQEAVDICYNAMQGRFPSKQVSGHS